MAIHFGKSCVSMKNLMLIPLSLPWTILCAFLFNHIKKKKNLTTTPRPKKKVLKVANSWSNLFIFSSTLKQGATHVLMAQTQNIKLYMFKIPFYKHICLFLTEMQNVFYAKFEKKISLGHGGMVGLWLLFDAVIFTQECLLNTPFHHQILSIGVHTLTLSGPKGRAKLAPSPGIAHLLCFGKCRY